MNQRLKIFVTGGSGMVGRNLLEHPGMAAFEVVAPPSSELDLRDRPATFERLRLERPDMVVHCAGKVGGIQANMDDPVGFLAANMDMGFNTVLAAREAGVPRLVNLGSSCMYPRDAPNPLREDMVLTGELEPTNEGYALAKVSTARLCSAISATEPGRSYVTIIPCNLYGRWDDFHPVTGHMIPAVVRKIHEAEAHGRDTVTIWGDGAARREFMYAGDLADLLVTAIGRHAELPDMMNVGPGVDHSVNDYYRAIASVVGWHGTFAHDLDKPSGMARKLTDVSRQRAFGWQPRTSLEKGLANTYTFFLEHC